MHPAQKIFENIGYKTTPYTGRGMRKSCLGVYLKTDICNMFADIIDDLKDTNSIADISYLFRSMRTDKMGKGMIVYFTSVEYEGDDDDVDE